MCHLCSCHYVPDHLSGGVVSGVWVFVFVVALSLHYHIVDHIDLVDPFSLPIDLDRLSLHYRIVGHLDLVDLVSLPIDLDREGRVHRNRLHLGNLHDGSIEVEVAEGRENVPVVPVRERHRQAGLQSVAPSSPRIAQWNSHIVAYCV